MKGIFKKIKITTKIISFSAALAAVFLGGSLLIIISDTESFVSSLILDNTSKSLDIRAKQLDIVFRELQNDLNVLYGYHGLKELIETPHGMNNETHIESMEEVNDFFHGFMISGEFLYDQIRYIDSMGQEMVRVDRAPEGKAEIIPMDKLQYKGDRDYFVETVKLAPGEVFTSNITLNKEGNPPQIQIPYKPVLRYSTPLHRENGEVAGVLVSNLLVQNIFEDLDLHNNPDFLIIDQDGYYLHHPDAEKEWGAEYDLNTGENFFKDYPIPDGLLSQDEGSFRIGAKIYSFRKVFTSQNKYWTLIEGKEESIIFDPLQNLIWRDLLIGLTGFSFLFILFYITIKRILNPLTELEFVARKISEGDFSEKVVIHNQDEIGVVSSAFNNMSDRLKSSYEDMEEKIQEKTKDLAEKISDLEGARIATLNVLEDVENEKELAASEKDKVETILQSIGDGVFVTDKEMNIILFNQAAADISGFTIEESIGKKYREVLRFISEEDGSLSDQFIDDVMKTGEIQGMKSDTLLVMKGGGTLPVADSAAPLKNKEGEIVGCVVVFRDSSHEREVDKAKTEFVSLASHQLRTPLTAINWYSEMLLSGDAGELNNDQKEFIDQIYAGNQRMVGLVNALLNVSRIDLGTFSIEPEPLRFSDIFEDVLRELSSDIEKKKMNITKDYDGIPLINADKNLTRIIFQNLLSNSVKYTPEGGNISVTMEVKGQDALIKISDTGYGIPRDQQKDVFKKLFRADNVQNKDVEGTGLGLYIIKEILEVSGGKIRFESEENKGTTFYITLPLSGMARKEGSKGLS